MNKIKVGDFVLPKGNLKSLIIMEPEEVTYVTPSGAAFVGKKHGAFMSDDFEVVENKNQFVPEDWS